MRLWLRLAIGALHRLLGWSKRRLKWLDDHAGSVGAIGAVLAILTAWGVSRCEYVAARHLDDEHWNNLLTEIGRSADEFEPMVQGYIGLFRASGVAPANYWDLDHENDPRNARMFDFNSLPVTQWPTIEAYDAFRQYYRSSLRVVDQSHESPSNTQIDARIKMHEGKLEALHKALAVARRK